VTAVMRYFGFIAQETREWLAKLGVRKLTDLIGRTDLLAIAPGVTDKQRHLNLQPILDAAGPADVAGPQHCGVARNAPFDRGELAERMVADMLPAIEARSGGEFHYTLKNNHRSIGARLSGEIAKRYGNDGMADAPVTVHCQGTAGQSFGVWNAGGLHLLLCGDANDYVGKGMAGGKITLYPPPDFNGVPHRNTIIGNTCLYGATGGALYAAGRTGERFAVRNPGAVAVVDGTGDHGCEYMTGGCVVVLGKTGVNFGAGMSGGLAFVLDSGNRFPHRYNDQMVEICRIDGDDMTDHLHGLIRRHVDETGSAWGRHILEHFAQRLRDFWLVKPKAADVNRLIGALRQAA